MRAVSWVLRLVSVLSLALIGCQPGPSPAGTPAKPTATTAPPTPVPQGRAIVVTSSADSGPGTLRQAVLDAESGDTIAFDPAIFPPDAPVAIYLTSSLPPVTQGALTIDASDAGVILDGSQFPETFAPALAIVSDKNSVRGLSIVHFPDTGIGIINGASGNTIGPDNTIAHNGGRGIEIAGPQSLQNTITQNSVYDNGMLGIDLWDGGNSELGAPIFTGFDLDEGTIVGSTCPHCLVEVFSDSGSQGEVYEGSTAADDVGAFSLEGAAFTGPHLTATATDRDGNTSGFSAPTTGAGGSWALQDGNHLPSTAVQPRLSPDLEDNHLGDMISLRLREGGEGPQELADRLSVKGLKWMRVSLDSFDWSEVEETGAYSQYHVDPEQDEKVAALLDSGIQIMYTLVFWDPEIQIQDEEYSRFREEDEVLRYLDYVRFVVQHFEGRVRYYELLNEPNIGYGTQQGVQVADYVNLVRRTVPVIRQEDPEARVVVGAVTPLYAIEDQVRITRGAREFLFGILESDVMPVVDAVSWHAMAGASPQYGEEYYYEYPSLLQEIESVASAHGFEGEYIAEELHWRTAESPHPHEYSGYGEVTAAKYLARGIVMNLGVGVITGLAENLESPPKMAVIQNLSTILAGAEPASLPIEIRSEATKIVSYGFSLPGGDQLIALWTDGVAVENDPGVEATVILQKAPAQTVMATDVLSGLEQEMLTDQENGDLVIRGLLVKDCPIVLRLTGLPSP